MQTNLPRTASKAAPLSIIVPLFILALISVPLQSHASASITATQTVANAAAVTNQTAVTTIATPNATVGTNDQTIALATTTANIAQVSASRTLTINSLPTNGQTTTIGSCVITYSSATSTDSLNCVSNAATLSITAHNSTSTLAAAIATLTHVSDAAHGALSISTSTANNDIFTTAGVETSATAISFTDGTSGAVTSTASTNGTIPATEILTLTPAGTVDTGDTYTVYSPGVFTATYTVQSTDSTIANIASGIVTTIKGLGGYSSLPFTAATSTNNIILTAKVSGTGFGLATSTTNRAAAAQVNDVTIGGTVATGATYSITIPTYGSVTYTAGVSDTYTKVANGLDALLLATSTYSSMPFTVGTTTSTVILTAKVAGTGFTNSSSATGVSAVAQQVTFTVPSFTSDADSSITINANTYESNGLAGSGAIAAGLTQALLADPAVTCSQTGLVITCIAKTPGTSFTYSANLNTYTPAAAENWGGGGGGSAEIRTSSNTATAVSTTPVVTTVAPVTTVTTTTSAVSGASKIKNTLKYKSRNSSVKVLQTILGSDASLDYTGGVTGYYGRMTEDAVEAFQVKYGVVQVGQAGYGQVGPKTKAMLIEVYGA